ncbi:MAG TPA: hypothetical protein VHQ64_11395, partial [Pyrinomonadaceae bacterium]|nr:hypothetical protein [Pyrinomonadaceae bacterium]
MSAQTGSQSANGAAPNGSAGVVGSGGLPANPSASAGDQLPSTRSSATREAPFGIIVEDGSALSAGQVHRTEFMESMSARIERVADEELSQVGQTCRDCPYLIYWLGFYRRRPAEHIERAIQRYSGFEGSGRAALETAVLARVRGAVQAWIRSGGREVRAP